MLWLDLIDIVYLIIGFVLGYVLCCGINKDAMDDECKDCEYRKFIKEVIEHGEQ